MTGRSLAMVLALSLLPACAHYHSDQNAPGLLDLDQPPESSAMLEPPGDPGESLLAFNSGVYSAGGITLGDGRTGDGAFKTGFELTLNHGVNERSHFEDDFVVYPEQGMGINLGLETLNKDGFGMGPFYLEGQLFSHFVGAAAGWSHDFNEGEGGPQLTFFGLNTFMRIQHLLGGETFVLFGLMGKSSLVWTKSQ